MLRRHEQLPCGWSLRPPRTLFGSFSHLPSIWPDEGTLHTWYKSKKISSVIPSFFDLSCPSPVPLLFPLLSQRLLGEGFLYPSSTGIENGSRYYGWSAPAILGWVSSALQSSFKAFHFAPADTSSTLSLLPIVFLSLISPPFALSVNMTSFFKPASWRLNKLHLQYLYYLWGIQSLYNLKRLICINMVNKSYTKVIKRKIRYC